MQYTFIVFLVFGVCLTIISLFTWPKEAAEELEAVRGIPVDHSVVVIDRTTNTLQFIVGVFCIASSIWMLV